VTKPIRRVVVLGGGTAGWLAACRIAARAGEVLDVTLVESPNIATIGVGEGTWPTMRSTLAAIGIGEAEFVSACDASFKQGSRFDGWVDGSWKDSYLHPFTPPASGEICSQLAAWQETSGEHAFAAVMTPQARVCSAALAPRQAAAPDYAGALNYAYHFDAGKLAVLLADHAKNRLGVRQVRDEVIGVDGDSDGWIKGLVTRSNGTVKADLFIDCSGLAAILIDDHCKSEWVDRSDVLFNDCALAAQAPVKNTSPIASQTIGTAHEAGWIWDIALPNRRGIGCVYSSRFMDDEAAEKILLSYLAKQDLACEARDLPIRKLTFSSGHRREFWKGNCLAMGMSAGFVEPLEASAIVMIELSLDALLANFPSGRAAMAIHADRFNALFTLRWDRIVEFLKLHYVLSSREEPYWQHHRDAVTVPKRLTQMLEIWRDQPPSNYDFPMGDEIFPSASYQYVLYGMGFTPPDARFPLAGLDSARAQIAQTLQRGRALAAALPENRTEINRLVGLVQQAQKEISAK